MADETEHLVADVLAGKTRAVARAMSIAEGRNDAAEQLMTQIHRHAGHAHVVGLTGVPGSGKSTMVAALTREFRKLGKTVGIVAIDPSSPFSGGAILGDRVRMTGFAEDDGVFIRSMATRGALGGLARASLDTVDVLDAAGFDVVLIETVGVGQDEVDIVQAAHTVIVVSAPGLGDEVQAIKAGVLEIADIHVVSKCDKPDASHTIQDINGMLHLGRPGKGDKAWTIPVVPTSAETGEGIVDLSQKIITHYEHLKSTGEMEVRKRQILQMRIIKTAEDILRDRLMRERDGKLQGLLEQAYTRDIDVRTAARELLSAVTLKKEHLAMTDALDARLQAVEELLAHRDAEIQDLSEMVSQQWKRIEDLEREIERTKDRIITLEDEVGDGPEADQKPPHW